MGPSQPGPYLPGGPSDTLVLPSLHLSGYEREWSIPGRVDQYLYPYYREDVEKGRITREEAIELLELLRCHFSSYRALLESSLQEKGIGEANWFNCMLGGQTPDGRDAANDMSFLWIEAAMRTRSPHPTLSIRVHEGLNEDLALKAAELSALGLGYPAWFGDRTTIPFLVNQGRASRRHATTPSPVARSAVFPERCLRPGSFSEISQRCLNWR